MKRISTLLLALLLALSACADCVAEETTDETVEPQYALDSLTVAVVNPMTGNFFTSLWGNNTSDADVRALIHGYSLVIWDVEQGMFRHDDTVINAIVGSLQEDGSHTYTIILNDDLYYCDGTPITAWDYAFSILLSIAPELDELGADADHLNWLVGYEDYVSGQTEALSGVRVTADDQLSISISGDYLPFFYELGLLSIAPYPISVIAPGVSVADDGEGVYLTNTDGSEEDLFTADLLKQTILDEQTGYLTHPSLTCGPYVLVSYEDGIAEFELNEYYKNDPMGNKPTIQHLTFKSLAKDELIESLSNGSVGLVNKVTGAEEITAGLELTGENELYTMSTYPRTGLGFISFSDANAALADAAVRQAIMYAMDRQTLAQDALSGYGIRADGYYGLATWMFQLVNGTLPYPIEEPAEGDAAAQTKYEEDLAKWESLNLEDIEVYEQDISKANALLDESDWNLNESGEAFDPTTDTLRYRQGENGLEPLSFTLAYGQGSAAGQMLVESLPQQLSAIGIELSVEAIPANALLAEYYGQTELTCDMLFLATNFSELFDPTGQFALNEDGLHIWATTGVECEELFRIAQEMNSTEPGDFYGYTEKWVAFQKSFMEKLPLLPIYSNVYFDFYAQVLNDYDILANASWAQAINRAYLAEFVPEEVEEGDEEFIGD